MLVDWLPCCRTANLTVSHYTADAYYTSTLLWETRYQGESILDLANWIEKVFQFSFFQYLPPLPPPPPLRPFILSVSHIPRPASYPTIRVSGTDLFIHIQSPCLNCKKMKKKSEEATNNKSNNNKKKIWRRNMSLARQVMIPQTYLCLISFPRRPPPPKPPPPSYGYAKNKNLRDENEWQRAGGWTGGRAAHNWIISWNSRSKASETCGYILSILVPSHRYTAQLSPRALQHGSRARSRHNHKSPPWAIYVPPHTRNDLKALKSHFGKQNKLWRRATKNCVISLFVAFLFLTHATTTTAAVSFLAWLALFSQPFPQTTAD